MLRRYRGEWKAGQRDGEGLIEYADGSRYRGSWAAGQKHGRGTYLYADGRWYIGEFEKDRMATGEPAPGSQPAGGGEGPKLFLGDMFRDAPPGIARAAELRGGEMWHASRTALLFAADLRSAYAAYGGGEIAEACRDLGILDARVGASTVAGIAQEVVDQERRQVVGSLLVPPTCEAPTQALAS